MDARPRSTHPEPRQHGTLRRRIASGGDAVGAARMSGGRDVDLPRLRRMHLHSDDHRTMPERGRVAGQRWRMLRGAAAPALDAHFGHADAGVTQRYTAGPLVHLPVLDAEQAKRTLLHRGTSRGGHAHNPKVLPSTAPLPQAYAIGTSWAGSKSSQTCSPGWWRWLGRVVTRSFVSPAPSGTTR